MFQHDGICYKLASTVNQLIGAEQAGTVVMISSKSYIISLASFSDNSITYRYSPTSGGAAITQVVDNHPPGCQLLTSADALQIAWLIAGAWIAVYAITFITRYIKNDILGANNDA